MGTIHINGKNYSYQGADWTNSIIKASNGKFYRKGADGKYREIKENGQSIFNSVQQNAKNKSQAEITLNKNSKRVPNKKYYVKGNSSYFFIVDKNFDTVFYKDNQRITKDQFLKGANCVYDAKNNEYVAKDAGKTSHKYDAKFRKAVKDSKTGRYYVNIKGGTRKYFEANGKEISERAFLDTEKAYIDSDGQIAKYDWKAKAKNAAKGIGNMFADMFTKEEPIYKKDAKGRVLLDKTGKPVIEKNKDGSPKTKRKFSLSRTCTTVIVGAAIAAACVFAAPVVAAGAAAVGIGAGTAATIGTVAGVATQLGIAGYFGYEGGKQMYEAEKENQNVLLSNNERMENWKKKGAGGAQVGMSLIMAKSAAKNAPKTHATARNTAKAIETKNNATLMTKGKVGFMDRVSNAKAGFSETVGLKSMKNTVKNYHKNNSLKTKVASTAKAPVKMTKAAIEEPVKLVTDVAKTGVRLVTKKGRAKIKGDFKAWRDSFRENPQTTVTETLTPEQIKTRQESFNNEIANMPKEAEARIKKYESLIENTSDKNQVGQLLDAIKSDKELTNSQRAEIATKFFEKNDAQYPGVLETAKHQKAELALKNAKTLDDMAKIDREALSEKSQKNFDKKKIELEKKKIKKASLEELQNIDRNALSKDAQAVYDKRLAKLEKQERNAVKNKKQKNSATKADTQKATEQNVTVNNNQSELHRITKNSNEPNNPNKIATKNSVGKLNGEKFKQVKEEFAKEVDNITSLEDANINILKQRAEAFGNRAQRRELQNLLNDRLKKLETKQEVPLTLKQTSTTKPAYTKHDVNKFQNKINNAKTFEELNSRVSELQKEGFFKKASKQQIASINKSIQTKRANLKKKIEVSENIRTKSNNWTYEDMLAEIRQLETDLEAGKIRTMSEIKAQLSHQNANYRKLPNEVKTDLHNRITSLERKLTEKAVEKMKQKNEVAEAEVRQNSSVNNNNSELHKITKNSNEPNNPNKIATKNSIGKLNSEKFKQVKEEFAKEVDNITSLEDANINILKQRAEAFGNRAQRRELQKLLNDKLKKLKSKTKTKPAEEVKPVEISKVEEPKTEQKSTGVIKKSRNYKKFEKMIEESTDMSKVRAKLSNNPKFNKLSITEQRQLIGKINQREALLETKASTPNGAQEASTSKETPKASNKEYDVINWFDNFKDMKTPTLGALNAVKSVDENIVIPQDKEFDSQLDPNQEYAYEEEPVQEESVSNTEGAEKSEVQVANGPEEVSKTDNTEENANNTDESKTTKETEVNTGEEETPADDTTAPSETPVQNSNPPAGNAQIPTSSTATNGDRMPITTSSTSYTGSNDNITSRQNSTRTTAPQDNNRTAKTDVQARQVQEESAAEQTVSQDNLEERDIPAEQKYNITQKVLNAESDEEIADALQTLREVGRFKGRKNLRRLLKAKRKNNQDRIQKYEGKVNSNINAINDAYRKKLED